MPNSIKISNLHNVSVWEKSLTKEEVEKVKDYVKGADTIPLIPATLVTVRTHNFEDFSKDFFLPTVVNHAIHVQHAVGKIFAILAAFVLDVLTFPIRLITILPRIKANADREETSLYKYLRGEEGVTEELLAANHVYVELNWETLEPPSDQQTDRNGAFLKENRKRGWLERNVIFIELPDCRNPSCSRFRSGNSF